MLLLGFTSLWGAGNGRRGRGVARGD
jgi:hypothetical protein